MRFRSAVVAVIVASNLSLTTYAKASDFGAPPSGRIPIIFNDHHVYVRPSFVRHGRVIAALVRGGQVLVPLKSMFKELGGTVEYDRATKSTIVRSGDTIVEVTVGVPRVRINSEVRPLDVAPVMYRGTVLVPVRVIAEALGAYVEYEQQRRVVVVRVSATPQPAATPVSAPTSRFLPPLASPRVTVPPGPPIPIEPPAPETFIAGDVAVVPQIANAYAPKLRGATGESFDVRATSEFSILDLPLDFGGEFTRYAYTHASEAVTSIGGLADAFVPAFDAHESELSFQLGAQINPGKVYVDASYVRLSSSSGYPSVGGLGIGVEKLPILARQFSYDASLFYYPNVSGACDTAACLPGVDTLSYSLLRYAGGITYGAGPVFIEAGYRGDSGRKKAAAPVSFIHSGPFVGIGFSLLTKIIRLALSSAVVLAGLPTGTPAQTSAVPAPAFYGLAYAHYRSKGSEVASGRLVVQLQNGALVAKNGASVLALPDSQYARWWLSQSAIGIRDRAEDRNFKEPEVPLQLRPFVRYAATDGDGNFRIGDLPRGRYIFRGRLSLAFPRELSAPSQSAAPYDVYGDQTAVHRSTVVFDYSVVWLDSDVVRVGHRPPDDIAFHLAARRNSVDAHRS